MGLFDGWKKKKKIKAAREEAKSNPTPKTTATFAEVLIECNEYDNALAVLEMGVKAFPDSDLLQQKFKQLKKMKYQDPIRELKRSIDQNPDPISYARLADIYIKIGEEDKAIEIGQTGTDKFPDYEGNHLILGKLRWERYRDNLIARDGVKAVEHFEQAVKLNPNNYKILFQLARIYVEIGAPQSALDKISIILQAYPHDDNAKKLQRRAKLLPQVRENDLDDLFKDFQSKNPNVKKMDSSMGSGIAHKFISDPAFLKDKSQVLLQLAHLQGLIIINSEDQVLLSEFKEGSLKGKVETSILRVVKAAKGCSLRMDIGALQDSRIEGPKGWIYLRGFVQLIFVFMFTKQARFRQIETQLAEFFEFGIYQ